MNKQVTGKKKKRDYSSKSKKVLKIQRSKRKQMQHAFHPE